MVDLLCSSVPNTPSSTTATTSAATARLSLCLSGRHTLSADRYCSPRAQPARTFLSMFIVHFSVLCFSSAKIHHPEHSMQDAVVKFQSPVPKYYHGHAHYSICWYLMQWIITGMSQQLLAKWSKVVISMSVCQTNEMNAFVKIIIWSASFCNVFGGWKVKVDQ